MSRRTSKLNYLVDIPGEESDEDDDGLDDEIIKKVFFGNPNKKVKTTTSPQQSQSSSSASASASVSGSLPPSTRSQNGFGSTNSSNNKNKETVLVEIEDNDDDDDDDDDINPNLPPSSSSTSSSTSAVINEAKDLLKKLAQTKSISHVSDIETIEIDDEPISSKIIVPKVKSAEERSKLSALSATAATSRLKGLLHLGGNDADSSGQNNKTSSSSSSAATALVIDYNTPRIKLKFRVNGKITITCSLPKSLSFANIRSSFQELMTNVSDASGNSNGTATAIGFVFDGELVAGDDTSEDLDLDDDMMIDMKVNKDIFESVSQNISANVTRIKLSSSQVSVMSVASRNQLLLLEFSDGRTNVVIRTR